VNLIRLYKVWRFRRKVGGFIKFFRVLDNAISKGSPRWKRRQFWSDFSKSEEFRRLIRKKLPEILLRDL